MRKLFADIKSSKVATITSPMFFSIGYILLGVFNSGTTFWFFLLGATLTAYIGLSCHVVLLHKIHLERMGEIHEEHLINMKRLEHLQASMRQIRGQDELEDFEPPVFH